MEINNTVLLHGCSEVLRRWEVLVEFTPNEIYSQRPLVFASAGEHFRHVYDHGTAIMAGLSTKVVDRHERERNVELETNQCQAKIAIQELSEQIVLIDPAELEVPIIVVDYGNVGELVESQTTLGCEMSFFSHHAIHHLSNALAAIALCGHQIPSDIHDLTLAFSTQAHLNTLQAG